MNSPTAIIVTALMVSLAAAQCGYTAPNGFVDLSTVPTATLPINQVYQGSSSLYTWVINLCNATSQPPAGTKACTAGAGYISEFATTRCETAWTTQTSPWRYAEQGAGKATFTNSKGWVANVYIGCGPTLSLQVEGNVFVTNTLSFEFQLTSSAACGGATPAPLTPAPTPPPQPMKCGFTSPTGTVNLISVPTTTLQIDQKYSGQSTPYTWVVNLCEAVNQPPPNAQPCPRDGFVSEYSTNACEAAWNTPTSPWSYDPTTGAGVVSLENSKGWIMKVFIGCGSTLALESAGDVHVSDSLMFTVFLTTSAACTSKPTPTPRPPTPPASNGTVTRLTCKVKGCRQCSGEVMPIGMCVPASGISNGSDKALSCSSQQVTIDSWTSSSTCGASFFPAKTSWPVGKCIEVGPGDYRFYTCSP